MIQFYTVLLMSWLFRTPSLGCKENKILQNENCFPSPTVTTETCQCTKGLGEP